MGSVSEMYKKLSEYLCAADLSGRDTKVIVQKTSEVTLKGKKKVLVNFKGHEKGLLLNLINATVISELLGDDYDAWTGKEITLFCTTTDLDGREVPCIRVRKEKVEAAEPETPF